MLHDNSLQDYVDPVSSLQTGLFDPIHSYLQSSSEPTVDGLLGTLSSGVSADGIRTSFREVGSQMLFDIQFTDDTSTDNVPLDLGLGNSAAGAGLDVSLTAQVVGELNLDFTLGVDMARLGDPGEAFFIIVNNFSATVRVNLYDADISFKLGFLEAGIQDGVIVASATLTAGLKDPDLDGHLSLHELRDTSFSDLVGLSFSSSVDAELPIHASVGGFSTSTTTPPTILVSDSDLLGGSLPDVTLQNFDQILDFTSFDADSILAMLRALAERLRGMGQTSAFNFEIPFTGKRLGDAVDLGLDFVDTLTSITGDPTFTGAQSLATKLADALGIDISVVNPVFNPTSRELTYTIDYSKNFNQQLGFEFDAAIDPIAAIDATGNISFAGSVDFVLKFGIDVSPISAKIIASGDAPASGNFAGEAIFQLTLGSDSPVEVRFFGNGNVSIADLVADINAALTTAGLASKVKAEQDGNKIQLQTTHLSLSPTLRITAAANNPAVTALHLPTDQDAADTPFNHVFIRDQNLVACFGLNGSLAASATLGFVGITGGLSAGGELDFSFAPAGGARVGLQDLFRMLTTDVAALGIPLFTGSSYFHVDNLAVSAQGIDLGLGSITIPSGQHQISVNIDDYVGALPRINLDQSLLAGLNKIKDMDFDDVLAALEALANSLVDMAQSKLMGVEIPGIGLSVGELLGFAQDFKDLLVEMKKPENRAAALEDLEDQLRAKLSEVLSGITPTLDLSFETDALMFQFGFTRQVATDLDLNLNLGELGILPNDLSLLEIDSDATIPFAGGLTFTLEIGIDLTVPTAPKPFISRDSQFGLSTSIVAPNVNLDITALNALSLYVRGGSLKLDQD
ncbi:MAG TPA: hypothetical protein VIY86_03060, partial [Pirellulaceae bacterium]